MRGHLLFIALILAGCGRADEPAIVKQARNDPLAPPAPAIQHKDFGNGVYEPLYGDPERKIILDALRPKVVAELGLPVEFGVTTLHVKDDWAFAVLEPFGVNGRRLALKDTDLANGEGEIDGLRTEAVWRKTGGVWTLDRYVIGATDVWYVDYCPTAPEGLIPICGNEKRVGS